MLPNKWLNENLIWVLDISFEVNAPQRGPDPPLWKPQLRLLDFFAVQLQILEEKKDGVAGTMANFHVAAALFILLEALIWKPGGDAGTPSCWFV